MFAALECDLFLFMAVLTFHTEHLLLGCLGGLPEDRFRLSSETPKFHVVPPLTESLGVTLSSLVLGNLVLGMTLAFLVSAECPSQLGNVHHFYCRWNRLVKIQKNREMQGCRECLKYKLYISNS